MPTEPEMDREISTRQAKLLDLEIELKTLELKQRRKFSWRFVKGLAIFLGIISVVTVFCAAFFGFVADLRSITTDNLKEVRNINAELTSSNKTLVHQLASANAHLQQAGRDAQELEGRLESAVATNAWAVSLVTQSRELLNNLAATSNRDEVASHLSSLKQLVPTRTGSNLFLPYEGQIILTIHWATEKQAPWALCLKPSANDEKEQWFEGYQFAEGSLPLSLPGNLREVIGTWTYSMGKLEGKMTHPMALKLTVDFLKPTVDGGWMTTRRSGNRSESGIAFLRRWPN